VRSRWTSAERAVVALWDVSLTWISVTHGINWPLWPSIEISPDSLDGFLRSKLPLDDGS